jgi:hypothetical protein
MALSFLLDEHFRGPLWTAVQRHNLRAQHPIDVGPRRGRRGTPSFERRPDRPGLGLGGESAARNGR